MQPGASAFASIFPPPRARWADDLTLSTQVLTGVRAPVLLVHGAQDCVTPLATAARPPVEHLAYVRLHVLAMRARAGGRASARFWRPLTSRDLHRGGWWM